MQFSYKFISELQTDPYYSLALYHRSARSDAAELMRASAVTNARVDAWETLGSELLSLYAARMTLNNTLTRRVAIASPAVSAIKLVILNRIASAIRLAELSVFGAAVRMTEKSLSSFVDPISCQLIGAISAKEGFNSAVLKVIFDSGIDRDLHLPLGKEEKTQLQELAQGRKYQLPKYVLISEVGAKNRATFHVSVSIGERIAQGRGQTKKMAEQNAASAFLSQYYPTLRRQRDVNFSNRITTAQMCGTIPTLPNDASLRDFCARHDIPIEFSNLVGLSFTHASFNFSGVSMLGRDNKLLSFFGSHVLLWAAKHALANDVDEAKLSAGGGISAMTQGVVNEQTLAGLFDKLNIQSLLLLGAGEKIVTASLKVEFIQAFCGALFLIREGDSRFGVAGLFEGVEPLHEYFCKNLKIIPLDKEAVQSPKTRLHERTQSVALATSYTSFSRAHNTQATLQPSLTMQSAWMVEQLIARGMREESAANKARRKGEAEADLAEKIIFSFDRATGSRPAREFRPGSEFEYVEKWLLQHCLGVVRTVVFKEIGHSRARHIANAIMGLKFLRKGAYEDFASWHRYAEKTLRIIPIESESTLVEFYSEMGGALREDKTEKKLSSNLRELASYLSTVDPLSESSDIRAAPQFMRLLNDSMCYKLLGGAIQVVTVASVLESVSYFLGDRITVAPYSTSLAILEVQGAHVAVFNCIVSELFLEGSSAAILVEAGPGGSIRVAVTMVGLDEMHIRRFHSSSLWAMLKLILPITNINQDSKLLEFSIPSLVDEDNSHLLFWLSFVLQGKLGTARNDNIATVLHDIKNEILGFLAASRNARNKTNVHDRYLLASKASQHVASAVSMINVVDRLLDATALREARSIIVEDFMRKTISDFWVWVPKSVKFLTPLNACHNEIWTNPDMLSSILKNLVLNAVEAMNQDGRLEINYEYFDGDDTLRFTIQDTGPGFSVGNLALLNSGSPITSSKKNGQGIGLLTVLLLTKDLGGIISFASVQPNGTLVSIAIPSTPPLPL